MGRLSDRRRVLRFDGSRHQYRPDLLAVEEPLEIQLGGEPYSVTMRTPGDDVDLALGLLHSEGIVSTASDVVTAKHCTDSDLNVLEVTTVHPVAVSGRSFTVSSACGVCGTSSLDALRDHLSHGHGHDISADGITVPSAVLSAAPDLLRQSQKVFAKTGGLHGAALITTDGTVECVREDVGRHNAVDKVVGWALRSDRVPLVGRILAVSGRVGAEIVQKAAAAGIPVIAAVSAPSTMAVDLAKSWGITLAGFVRDNRFNVYSGFDRILPTEPHGTIEQGLRDQLR